MAWNYNENTEEKDLIYDLRQTYAQLLDEVLKRIAENRYEGNYNKWFNALDDLHTEIHQKLTPKEREEYQEKLKECLTILNKFPETYNGASKNQENNYKIKMALKQLELWLKDKMEKHRMFGAKEEAELL